MSGNLSCECPGGLAERMQNWVALARHHHHSAFAGYHYTRIVELLITRECIKAIVC
jgi:hypothetical protein